MANAAKRTGHRKPVVLERTDMDTPLVGMCDYIDAMFKVVYERIDSLAQRVDTLEKNAERRFDATDKRIDRMEKILEAILQETKEQRKETREAMAAMEQRINSNWRWIVGNLVIVALAAIAWIVSRLP